MDQHQETSTERLPSGEVAFDYVKSNHFRVIHVDGATGAVNPGGTTAHMAIFSERQAIPQKEVHGIVDGVLGEKLLDKTETRGSIVREVEIDLILGLRAAQALRGWLDRVITNLEDAQQMIEESEKHDGGGN